MGQNNNRIKELREAKQMTVEELAKMSGLGVNRINRLEESPPERIMSCEAFKIADALEVTLRELVTNG